MRHAVISSILLGMTPPKLSSIQIVLTAMPETLFLRLFELVCSPPKPHHEKNARSAPPNDRNLRPRRKNGSERKNYDGRTTSLWPGWRSNWYDKVVKILWLLAKDRKDFAARGIDQSSNALPPREQVLPVKITNFNQTQPDEYRFELYTESEYIGDFKVGAIIAQETLDLLRQAIELQRVNKNSYTKALCSINFRADKSNTWVLSLDTQIIWRNATSLTESRNNKQNDLLAWLTSDTVQEKSDAWSPSDFYDSVHVPDKSNGKMETLDVPGLECQLYPFQKRAIHWLLNRENADEYGQLLEGADLSQQDLLHGFVRSMDVDGKIFYVNQWLGIATTDPNIVNGHATRVSGGILAEEMGLGKTVEMISLLLLHKRKRVEQNAIKTEGSLRTSGSTLIVTPEAILQQWQSEIHMHAPSLTVMIYEGIKSAKKAAKEEDMIGKLLRHDVVLATYRTLAKEIHFSGAVPQRSLRHKQQYKRKLSPLVQIHWWRCVLDECQMVESGVSHAARVANQIPRHHAWAVSGTPLKKDASDLFGLLTFLRLEPYCNSLPIWNRLVAKYKTIFKQLFGAIALRHTKDQVRKDIQLPPQKRVVITVPFTQIEEQYYLNMYQEMCNDCGLDLDGAPLSDDYNPNDPFVIERMRSWLSRLRQICLHPEVGDRNRKALGHAEGTLRTVGEVLQVMMDQNETATRTEERSFFLSRLRRGQILEHAKQTQEALAIWLDVLDGSRKAVEECRDELQRAHEKEASALSSDEHDADANARLGVFRLRLRSALEVEHMSTFFVATAYYQIKSDESLTEPNSERFKELEKIETETYERAKVLRAEILKETQSKADGLMTSIKRRAKSQDFVVIPNFKHLDLSGGIESRNVLHKLEILYESMNEQAEKLDEVREKMVELLLLPLVDQEEEELQGDEYETSTKQQDEVYVYMAVLRAMVADRRDVLTGQENTLIKSETATALQLAIQGEGHSPELMRTLLLQRQKLKPSHEMGSIRGILSELRAMKTTLRGQEEHGSTRASAETAIINRALQNLQAESTKHTKAVVDLESEATLYKDTMNARLDYYRQLQTISDAVAPYEDEVTKAKLAELERIEAKMKTKIATLKSRGRYLIHLQEDSSMEDVQRKCIICQDEFEIGTLTSCGHAFCKECLNLWWRQHSTCPTCKKYLKTSDFHQITYARAPKSRSTHSNINKSDTNHKSSPCTKKAPPILPRPPALPPPLSPPPPPAPPQSTPPSTQTPSPRSRISTSRAPSARRSTPWPGTYSGSAPTTQAPNPSSSPNSATSSTSSRAPSTSSTYASPPSTSARATASSASSTIPRSSVFFFTPKLTLRD